MNKHCGIIGRSDEGVTGRMMPQPV